MRLRNKDYKDVTPNGSICTDNVTAQVADWDEGVGFVGLGR
jgi:hypothetical protein